MEDRLIVSVECHGKGENKANFLLLDNWIVSEDTGSHLDLIQILIKEMDNNFK